MFSRAAPSGACSVTASSTHSTCSHFLLLQLLIRNFRRKKTIKTDLYAAIKTIYPLSHALFAGTNVESVKNIDNVNIVALDGQQITEEQEKDGFSSICA